ncbi:MAG: threonylcarbamoyl-AMP synthase [Kiritimatiellae bacterium]|nr:threonylcarbamoyl-AMP synthase [Kiritimatiellia bacterium]
MTDPAIVAEALLAGKVAVIPTDTVYGLAAHPLRPEAVERLYTIKERDARKPIALLAADVDTPAKLGYPMPEAAQALAARHWPGALTMVLDGGQSRKLGETEAFRCPDLEWTRELLRLCGGALRVTSANMSGAIPATDAAKALEDVGLKADIVVDGGRSRIGIASTVVSFTPEGGIVTLRKGAVEI